MSAKCKHILELSTEDKQRFMDSFNIVISDCDGVLWTISMPLPNTGPAVNLLKKHGKDFKFMSNNGMWSDQEYKDKIEKIGVQVTENNDIVIPVKAIARHMNANYPGQQCQCVGTDIFCNALRENGVDVLNVTPSLDIHLIDLQDAVTPPKDGPLIVDTNIYMTYIGFAKIHQYISQANCQIFVSAIDSRLSVGENFSIIGPGKFLNVLWESTDNKPIIFGKPSSIMADYLVEEFNIKDRKCCLFVGDNLNVDIEFASRHGFQTLFVLSGTHTKDEMLNQPVEYQPDYYADSIADFIELFKDIEQNKTK